MYSHPPHPGVRVGPGPTGTEMSQRAKRPKGYPGPQGTVLSCEMGRWPWGAAAAWG